MKRLQPVIWMKGTFLSPQYLQTQDRFIESCLQFQLDALSYCGWGFHKLMINQEALAAGYLAISEASGIFPDGLLFDIPGADQAPSPKMIAESFEADQNTLDIYLAIPHYREKGLNVSLARAQADTRYLSEVAMLRDENTGLAERPIQVARKNFRIMLEGESQKHTSVMRVCRVRKSPAGTFDLDPDVVPPLLDFTASQRIGGITRRLVEILSAKSAQLAGMRRQKNLNLAEFGTADIASFWLLYTINSHFPLFQHLYEIRHGHPEKLYSLMLTLAGALTTFAKDLHPRELPKYDHDNLGTCFPKLDDLIRHLLDTVIPSNFISLPLRLTAPSIYSTLLQDDKYLRDTRLYLAISTEAGEGDVISKGPYLLKVCSQNHIEHLVQRALPGLPLTHIARPPSAIPMKMNHVYFSISQSGACWEAITRARNFSCYIPGDFPNPSAELLILLPEAR
jgi:type VI secretion system protein ImpJ